MGQAQKDAPKNEWTLTKNLEIGKRYSLAEHNVRIEALVREEPTYNVYRVKVLGPFTEYTIETKDGPKRFPLKVAPMNWGKELCDTEGEFTPQGIYY